jgi:NADH-quinone oxidoreductase subunit G
VILPGAAYTEKDAIYVNMEGRAQFAHAAVQPPYKAMPDWQIINSLTEYLGYKPGYSNLEELRALMFKAVKSMRNVGEVIQSDINLAEDAGSISRTPLKKIAVNFYMTDPISRSSVTMAKCTEMIGNSDEASNA